MNVYRFTKESDTETDVQRYTQKRNGNTFVKRFTSIAAALLLTVSFLCRADAEAYSIMNDRNVFRQHKNDCMKIALTFDDGPSAKYTSDILDYLRDEDIRATFFVVGSQARANPELVAREEAEGHEIGNHTDSHPHLRHEPIPTLQAEILACERTVYELTDTRTTLFRPPEGHCTADISALVEGLDYRIILWNIDTRDWADTTAAGITENILTNVQSGDIILFHDSVSRKESQTLNALKAVVPELKRRGYRFVTVSELLGTDSTDEELTVSN